VLDKKNRSEKNKKGKGKGKRKSEKMPKKKFENDFYTILPFPLFGKL